MGQGRNWTVAELEYLEEKWGQTSIPCIAKALNRSINAVKVKAIRIGLTRFIHSGEYITLNQLFNALGKGNIDTFTRDLWLKHGCPIKHRKSIKAKVAVIHIDEFWDWVKEHKDLIDLSRMESLTLGQEPVWAAEKRKADYEASINRGRKWTLNEDKRLVDLLKQYKYGYAELSKMLLRTEGAIKRRICTLGLRERPVSVDDKPWTENETQQLLEMRDKGYTYESIARRLNRSALAVRGKHERLQRPDYFLRENRRIREANVS